MNLEPNYIGRTNKVQNKKCTFFISNWNEYSDSKQVFCYGNESRNKNRKCTKEVTFGFKKFKKTKTFMQKNPYVLQPRIKPLIVEGKLSYNENVRCNNILRFKKEIREEFEALQSKEQLISYRMEYYRNEDELQSRISQIIKDKIGLPFLLFLFNGGNVEKEW